MSFPFTHHLTASSSRMMHNVTKLMTSQAGFFNMRLLLFAHFHSHQISIQWRYFGICLNQGFTLEMCSWHFCSSYCDNIMSTLTKTCDKCFQPCWKNVRKELGQFSSQKVVQVITSKVYQIKWPTRVCWYSHTSQDVYGRVSISNTILCNSIIDFFVLFCFLCKCKIYPVV